MEISKEMLKKMTEYGLAYLTDDGKEINDPRPTTLHTGLVKPLTLSEQVKRLMHQELSHQAIDQGHESEEEANDFDIESDPEVKGNYDLMEEEYIAAPIVNNTTPKPTVGEIPKVENPEGDQEEAKTEG